MIKIIIISLILIILITSLANWIILIYNEHVGFKNSDKLDKWCKLCTRISITSVLLALLVSITSIFL